MSKRRIQITAVALVCTVAGAAAGIAGGTAATSKKHAQAGPAAVREHLAARGLRFGPHGPAVHEEAVVLNKAGDGFITVTSDSGTLVSASGDQLTLKELVGSVTYKTITLTIPSGATVMRNFKTASLSDLRTGDRVHVSSSSEGTAVLADDGSTLAPHARRAPGARHYGLPDGPPPGLPGAAPPDMQSY